jgi:hypothetical protein
MLLNWNNQAITETNFTGWQKMSVIKFGNNKMRLFLLEERTIMSNLSFLKYKDYHHYFSNNINSLNWHNKSISSYKLLKK